MSLVLVALGLALLALPGALAARGAALAPAEWCRTVAVSLRVGRVAVQLGLAMLAAPVLLEALGARGAAHTCHRSFHGGVPVPWLVGGMAAGLLALVTVRSLGAYRRDAHALDRLRVPRWLGSHRRSGGVDVVSLPTDEVVAYAVPGRPGQIVISSRLSGALAADELAAVVDHERAHLRHRHHALLRLAADLDARVPEVGFVRRSTGVLRLAVERWADEDAAAVTPAGRSAVRRALVGTVAVALDPAAGFTSPCTLVERLDALGTPPPRPGARLRMMAAAPAVALCAATAATLVAASTVATHHGFLGMVGLCIFR